MGCFQLHSQMIDHVGCIVSVQLSIRSCLPGQPNNSAETDDPQPETYQSSMHHQHPHLNQVDHPTDGDRFSLASSCSAYSALSQISSRPEPSAPYIAHQDQQAPDAPPPSYEMVSSSLSSLIEIDNQLD